MKRIIYFKEQCHPQLATEIHFSLGGFFISKQFLSFFFFFGLAAFFSKFAVFHFVLEKQDRENGQKEDGKQYCSSPFAYRIKSKALSSSLSVFHTCRP